MQNIKKLVKERRSFRTFDGQPLKESDLEALRRFMENVPNPYVIPVGFKLLSAKEDKLTCPVVVGTDLYVGGRVERVKNAPEAFGYSFEAMILFAQSLGVGTVWLGGTMDRAAFEKAMELSENERMPAASPLGYPAEKMSLRETMMRKTINADSRMEFGELFFDGGFDTPLTPEKAGRLAEPLEMVRWAPSAVNKQPWRALVCENAVHFYLQRTKGFGGDMQNIDLGIALCHFEFSARENGIPLRFALCDPKLDTSTGAEYVASYLIEG